MYYFIRHLANSGRSKPKKTNLIATAYFWDFSRTEATHWKKFITQGVTNR